MEVYLIYASTSGNVEATVEYVSKILRMKGFETILCRAEQTHIEVITKNDKFIFATSTWEHGRLNPFFDELYNKMQKIDGKGKEAAFMGLGDRRYEPVLFCEGVEKVCRLWSKIGGSQIEETIKIQGEPYEQLNSLVAPWVNKIAQEWGKQND